MRSPATIHLPCRELVSQNWSNSPVRMNYPALRRSSLIRNSHHIAMLVIGMLSRESLSSTSLNWWRTDMTKQQKTQRLHITDSAMYDHCRSTSRMHHILIVNVMSSKWQARPKLAPFGIWWTILKDSSILAGSIGIQKNIIVDGVNNNLKVLQQRGNVYCIAYIWLRLIPIKIVHSLPDLEQARLSIPSASHDLHGVLSADVLCQHVFEFTVCS